MPASFSDKYGPWAIVTGASSGIGAEFARQLAQKGLNLLLIARRKDMLEDLSKELAGKYQVNTKVLELDLTREDILDVIIPETEGLDIGLLVNNAGMNCEGIFTVAICTATGR